MIVMMWHKMLKMPKKDRKWHEDDIADELQEYYEAPNWVYRWSELSDVAYTYSRARYSGHNLSRPLNRRQIGVGYCYMLPKYTLRYLFFRHAGKPSGVLMREVRNPQKIQKLKHIAKKYAIEPQPFIDRVNKQLKYWILLP